MRRKISRHVSYKEAVRSNTAIKHGIDNKPNEFEIFKMEEVADKLFEPVRRHFNVPIAITSFFRSSKLNKKIGGSRRSQHCNGEAIDMDADVYKKISNSDIFNYIKDNLEFDKLIWEFGDENEPDWVHASYVRGKNRNEILVAYKESNKFGRKITKYKYYE